jgi:4-hydroxy-tetrahydrodipicolinate reductase
MGRAVIRAIAESEDLELCGALASLGSPSIGRDAGENAGLDPLGVQISAERRAALGRADLAIDFSLPVAVAANIAACVERRCPVVVGTTGLSHEALETLRSASAAIAVLHSPNMSVGVNLMFRLAEIIGGALGDDYDVEILDLHHRNKVDAPSGTALRIGETVARARGVDFRKVAVMGRQGATGPRERGQIGFAALRAGEHVGRHTLMFSGPGESLSVTHEASDRMSFARGALRAARWLRERPPGLYSMKDVFGF